MTIVTLYFLVCILLDSMFYPSLNFDVLVKYVILVQLSSCVFKIVLFSMFRLGSSTISTLHIHKLSISRCTVVILYVMRIKFVSLCPSLLFCSH